jgi:hypothetical protein
MLVILLLLLLLYSGIAFTIYQFNKHHPTKVEQWELPVPEYTGNSNDSEACFFYSLAWVVTVPITLIHHYITKPYVQWISKLGDSDD